MASDKPSTSGAVPVTVAAVKEWSHFLGPYLRWAGWDPDTKFYKVTCLALVKGSTVPPRLTYKVDNSKQEVPAALLEEVLGYKFYRFELSCETGAAAKVVSYMLTGPDGKAKTHQYHVPSSTQTWQWGFYSCNGFSFEHDRIAYKGLKLMWDDVLSVHKSKPMHIMVGGGDQLYCDPVWECASLKDWLNVDDSKAYFGCKFNDAMQREVTAKYLQMYLDTWNEPGFTEALAVIPQAMCWDDHDIFDGYGSYPENLQNSHIFKGIFEVARRFYCLFQQHSTEARIQRDNGVFGKEGWNWVSQLGPTTALVLVDARMERTRTQVVSPESWALLKERLQALPSSVRHVMVVLGVPILYKIGLLTSAHFLTDHVLCCITGRTTQGRLDSPGMSGLMLRLKQAMGLNEVLNQFGEIEVEDDLTDHWSNDNHGQEKLDLIHMLQGIAERRLIRFTFVSGDVHLAAVARLKTAYTARPDGKEWPREKDSRLMYQIVSSAIGNAPPPRAAARAFEASITTYNIDPSTLEEMVPLRKRPTRLLVAKRNWVYCEPSRGEDLQFVFRVEKGSHTLGLHRIKSYDPVWIPALYVDDLYRKYYDEVHSPRSKLAIAAAHTEQAEERTLEQCTSTGSARPGIAMAVTAQA